MTLDEAREILKNHRAPNMAFECLCEKCMKAEGFLDGYRAREREESGGLQADERWKMLVEFMQRTDATIEEIKRLARLGIWS